jgi:hypothetical protein
MSTSFVLKLEYGARLSDQDRQVLEQAIRDVRQVKPRHDLILEDDSPDNVHVILDGFACRYKRGTIRARAWDRAGAPMKKGRARSCDRVRSP